MKCTIYFIDVWVQLATHPCFTELCKTMFHLSKHTATETTSELLFFQRVVTETLVGNINKTLVTDWRALIVRTENDSVDIRVNDQPL